VAVIDLLIGVQRRLEAVLTFDAGDPTGPTRASVGWPNVVNSSAWQEHFEW